ncbi:MAG: flagellar brake protein [Maledivibacter sp.]|nr:flagellar brake protein [Maledivibacter sp.]
MEKKITNLLNIGDNIEIEIEKGSSFLKMKSDIVKVLNDSIISISAPIHKGTIYPISVGSNVTIVFNKDSKGKFYFIGEIIDRKKKGNLTVLFVKKHSDIRHFQRRDFYRLSILLNINLEIIENGVTVKTVPAISKDISGGGLRIITKEKIQKHTAVKCIIYIDDEAIEALGKIVRCDPMPDSILKYDVGVSFTSIDEKNRSKIISFVFDSQRKIIKKGLI